MTSTSKTSEARLTGEVSSALIARGIPQAALHYFRALKVEDPAKTDQEIKDEVINTLLDTVTWFGGRSSATSVELLQEACDSLTLVIQRLSMDESRGEIVTDVRTLWRKLHAALERGRENMAREDAVRQGAGPL